jgi:hypothetical protein
VLKFGGSAATNGESFGSQGTVTSCCGHRRIWYVASAQQQVQIYFLIKIKNSASVSRNVEVTSTRYGKNQYLDHGILEYDTV